MTPMSGQRPRKPGSGQRTRKPAPAPVAATDAAEAKAKRRAAAEAAAEKARVEAQRRARRRRNQLLTWTSIGLVVVAVAVLVVVKLTAKPPPEGSGISAADPAVVSTITSLPLSVLDEVGDGGVPQNFYLPAGKPALLTENGLPRVLYVGGLFCPFCAAQRWAIVAALSRFGTFTGLQYLVSAKKGETVQSIHTFDLSGVTYTSSYLVFSPFETEDRNHKPLQALGVTDSALLSTYDAPPTLPQGASSGTIPFLDIGNRWVVSSASYEATLLEGKSWAEIASAASKGTGVGRQIVGTANWLTAAICSLTANKPPEVCSDPLIAKLQARLPSQ